MYRICCGHAAEPRRSTNVGLMSGQLRRQWANIKPAMTQNLVLIIGCNEAVDCCTRTLFHETLIQCWFNAGSQTVAQQKTNIGLVSCGRSTSSVGKNLNVGHTGQELMNEWGFIIPECQNGVRTRDLRFSKQTALTSAPAPPPLLG